MSLSLPVACLDIGTTKVTMILASYDPKGERQLNVTAHATCPCRGLSRGMVVDIDATVDSIRSVTKQVKEASSVLVKDVIVGISGNHIQAIRSNGIVAVGQSEIQQSDVDRVIEAAKAVAVPSNQTILHVLPQEFIVDEQTGVENPVGMAGVRLEVRVLMVTCSNSALQNIVKCVEKSGLIAQRVVLEQLASGYSVLSRDEKDLGVCVLDIGGGTTDIAVYTKGSIQYVDAIPVAGDHVTNDIAMALRTPPNAAEEVKLQHGVAAVDCVEQDHTIEVATLSGTPPQKIMHTDLLEVVEARYHEIFALVSNVLHRQGFDASIPGGVVLTGGASLVPGVKQLAERVLGQTARVAEPSQEGVPEELYSPRYATAVGLILQGCHGHDSLADIRGGSFMRFWQKVKIWLEYHL